MVSTNNLKNGMTLLLDDKLWQVVTNEHHKPGKGQAVVRTRLKQVETGKVVEFVDEELEALQKRIAEKLGFRLVDHRMELYGVSLDRAR